MDAELLYKVAETTGVQEKTKLVNMGLKALIKEVASMRLAALGGQAPNFSLPSRKSRYNLERKKR